MAFSYTYVIFGISEGLLVILSFNLIYLPAVSP